MLRSISVFAFTAILIVTALKDAPKEQGQGDEERLYEPNTDFIAVDHSSLKLENFHVLGMIKAPSQSIFEAPSRGLSVQLAADECFHGDNFLAITSRASMAGVDVVSFDYSCVIYLRTEEPRVASEFLPLLDNVYYRTKTPRPIITFIVCLWKDWDLTTPVVDVATSVTLKPEIYTYSESGFPTPIESMRAVFAAARAARQAAAPVAIKPPKLVGQLHDIPHEIVIADGKQMCIDEKYQIVDCPPNAVTLTTEPLESSMIASTRRIATAPAEARYLQPDGDLEIVDSEIYGGVHVEAQHKWCDNLNNFYFPQDMPAKITLSTHQRCFFGLRGSLTGAEWKKFLSGVSFTYDNNEEVLFKVLIFKPAYMRTRMKGNRVTFQVFSNLEPKEACKSNNAEFDSFDESFGMPLIRCAAPATMLYYKADAIEEGTVAAAEQVSSPDAAKSEAEKTTEKAIVSARKTFEAEQTTAYRFRPYNKGIPFNVFNAEDLTDLAATGTVYGVTVMVAADQWSLGTCAFTFVGVPATMTTANAQSGCVQWLNATLTGLQYAQILSRTTFSAASFDSLTINFALIVWKDTAVRRHILDHVSKTVFALHNPPDLGHKYDSADSATQCTSVSTGTWNVAYASTPTKNNVFTTLSGAGCAYLNLARSANNTAFVPGTSDQLATYNNWATGKPATNYTWCVQNCAAGWTDFACTAQVTTAVCQNTGMTSTEYQLLTRSRVSTNYAWLSASDVFTAATLPADASTTIYGARVTMMSSCTTSDRFVLRASNDKIVVVQETYSASTCVLRFVGTATLTEYNRLLISLQWIAFDTSRTAKLTFSLVYSKMLDVQDVIGTTSNKVHAVFTGRIRSNPQIPYPFSSYYDTCQSLGMIPSEIQDVTEASDTLPILNGRNVEIGVWKPTGASAYKYFVGTGTPYQAPAGATTPVGTAWCTYRAAGTGSYTQQDCNTTDFSYIQCEISTWSGMIMNNVQAPNPPFRRGWDGSSPLNPFNVSFGAGIYVPIYGATAQIALASCVPGDTLTLTVVGSPAMTPTWQASQCALKIVGSGSETAATSTRYGAALQSVQLTTTSTTIRGHIAFSYVLWTVSNTVHMYHDIESHHSYIAFPVSTLSWNGVRTSCQNLGSDFDLPMISYDTDSYWANQLNSGGYALGLYRDASKNYTWQDPTTKYMYYEWSPNFMGAVGNDCVMQKSDGSGWVDTNCGTGQFSRAVCESSTYSFSGSVAFVVIQNKYQAVRISPIVSGLSSSTTVIYGATIQSSALACNPLDMFYVGTVLDNINVVNSDPCYIMWGGPEIITSYNIVMNAAGWSSGDNRYRTSMTFGWVYWSVPQVRRMVMDVATSNVYVQLGGRGLSFSNASYMCFNASMVPFYETTATDGPEMRLAMITSNVSSWVASKRTVGAAYTWSPTATAVLTYDSFPVLYPAVNTNLCLATMKGQSLIDVSCELNLPTMCRSSSWTYKGTYTPGLSPLNTPNINTARYFTIDVTTKLTVNPAAQTGITTWMSSGTTKVYGATIQLATSQCDATYTFASTASLNAGVTATVDTTGCRVVFTGPDTLANYALYLNGVTVKTTTWTKASMTFAYALWDMAYKDLMIDVEVGEVMVALPMVSTSVWSDASVACRNLHWSANFEMAEVINPGQNLMVSRLAGGVAVPIRMYRNSTSAYHDLLRGGKWTPHAYSNWAAGSPINAPGTADCVAMVSGVWNDVSCTSYTYTRAVCKSSNYWNVVNIALMRPIANYTKVLTQANPFAAFIPAATATPIYGMTLASQATLCEPTDRFVMTTGYDNHVTILDRDCMLKVAGTATQAVYASLLSGINFVTGAGRRTNVRMSFVFWRSDIMFGLVLDTTTNNLYFPIETSMQYTSNILGLQTINQLCTSLYMATATVYSANETAEIARLGYADGVFLGAYRPNTATNYSWNWGTTSLSGFADFSPFGPQNGLNCLITNPYGQFVDADCLSQLRVTVCKSPQGAAPGAAINLGFTTPNLQGSSTLQLTYNTGTGLMTATLVPAAELAWLPNTGNKDYFVYSATVQIAIKQCTSQDTLTLNGASLGFTAYNPLVAFTSQYDQPTCTFVISGQDYFSTYQTNLQAVRLSIPSLPFTSGLAAGASLNARAMISISYVLWTNPVAGGRVWTDEETMTHYVYYNHPSGQSIWGAWDRCRSLGSGWSLVEPTNPRISAYLSNSAGADTPIMMIANPATGRYGRWSTVQSYDAVYYQNWGNGQPNDVGNVNCAIAASSLGWKWDDRDCPSLTLTTIMCQKQDYQWGWTHNFYLAPTAYGSYASNQFTNVFNGLSGSFPTTSGAISYGVTLQIRNTDCYELDRLIPTYTVNRISMVYSGDCVLQMAGATSNADYWTFTSNVLFQSPNALRRSTIGFGYVLWKNRLMRNVLMYITPSTTVGRIWSVYESTMIVQSGAASYTPFQTAEMCAAAGMTTAQVDSKDEQASLRMRPWSTGVLLGASRPANSVNFTWIATGTQMPFADFANQGAPANGLNCMQLNAAGGFFETVACSSQLPWATAALCMTNTTVYPGLSGAYTKTGVTLAPTTGVSTIAWAAGALTANVFSLTQSLSYLAPTTSTQYNSYVFGATVQLDIAQCNPITDYVTVSAALSGSLTATNDAAYCALHLKTGNNGLQLATVVGSTGLGSVVFQSTVQTRNLLTFGYTIWTNPAFTSMYMDLETKMVYTSLGVIVSTWNDAWQACRALGTGWRLYANRDSKSAKFVTNNLVFDAYLDIWRYNDTTQFLTTDPNTQTYMPLAYQNWDLTSNPVHPKSGLACGILSATKGTWQTVNCATSSGRLVMCERSSWNYLFGSAWNDPNVNKNLIRSTSAPFAAMAGAGDYTILYGATMIVSSLNCYTFDRWNIPSGVGDIDILLRNSSDCRMILSGKAYRWQYANLMRVATYNVANFKNERGPSAFTFGYLQWLTPALLDAIPEFGSAFAYVTIPSTAQYTTTGYNFNSASQICAANGWTLASILTQSAQNAVHMTLQYGSSWLGATRVTSTSAYTWDDASSWSGYSGLRPWISNATSTSLCLKHDQFNEWTEAPCSSWLNSVTCKVPLPSAPAWFTGTDAASQNTDMGNQQLSSSTNFRFNFDNSNVSSVYGGSTALYVFQGPYGTFRWGAVNNDYSGVREISKAIYYLSPQFCGAGDSLGVYGNGGAPPTGVTVSYDNASCTLTATSIAATAPIAAFMYRSPDGLMNTIRYKSDKQCDTTRVTIQVNVVLFTDSRINTMWMDYETRNVFALVPPPAPVTWNVAYTHCRNFGPGWRLAAPLTTTSRAWFNRTTLGSPLPILIRRDAANWQPWFQQPVLAGTSSTMANFSRQDWNTGFPVTTTDFDCVQRNANNGDWENIHCNTGAFTQVVCQRDSWDMSQQYVWRLDRANFISKAFISPVYSTVPSSGLTNTMYGATAMLQTLACRQYDVFIPQTVHMYIAVHSQGDCYIHFRGKTTVSNYNSVMSTLAYSYQDVSRLSVLYTFGLIYWYTSQAMPDFLAFEGTNYYAGFNVISTWTVNPNYPYYHYRDQCLNYQMRLGSLETQFENTAATTMVYRPQAMLIGAIRPGPGAAHVWDFTNTTLSWARWTPGQPSAPTKQCVEANSLGIWNEVDCTVVLRWMLCEGTAASLTNQWTGSTTKNFYINSANGNTLPYTSSFQLGGFSGYSMTNPVDSNQLKSITITSNSQFCNYMAYGHTLQLAIQQCIPGTDQIADPQAVPNGWSQSYHWSTCTFYTNGYGYITSGSAVKSHTDLLLRYIFYTWDSQQFYRQTLHFSWIIWNKPGVLFMQYDVENSMVYSSAFNLAAMSWNQAANLCFGYGYGWRLAQPNNIRASKILSGTTNQTQTNVPLYLQRNATSAYLDPDTRTQVWFQNFADGYPATQNNFCMGTDKTKQGRWIDVDCTAALYTTVVCETNYWGLAWTNGGSIQQGNLDKATYDNNPFPSIAPASTSTINYGVTLYAPILDCRPLDFYWVYNYVDNQIVLQYQGDCITMWAGAVTQDRYAALMTATRWWAVDTHRYQITHSYIYWTTPYVRNIQVDHLQGAGYYFFPIESRVMATPNITYPYYSAAEFCENLGMQWAQVEDAEMWQIATRTLTAAKLRKASIAASRPGSSGAFTWHYSATAVLPIDGATSPVNFDYGNNCLVQTQRGPFIDVNCSSYQPAVLCRGYPMSTFFDPTPKPYFNIGMANSYTLCGALYSNDQCPIDELSGANPVKQWQLGNNGGGQWYTWGPRTDTFNNYAYSNAWNTNNQAIVYGVSIQLEVDQCMPEWGDTISTSWLPGGLNSKYNYKTCTFHVYGNATMNVYQNQILSNAQLTSNTGSAMIRSRFSLTFAAVFWRDPTVTNFYVNTNTDTDYTFLTWPYKVSWNEAELICRQVNPGWHMASVQDNSTAHIIRSNTPTGQAIPIRHKRNATGTFGVFNWDGTVTPLSYSDWDQNQPNGTYGAQDCLAINGLLGNRWDDVACNDPIFTTIACEAPNTVNYLRHKLTRYVPYSSNYNYYLSPVQPFSSPPTFSGPGTVLYGATLQSHTFCRLHDRFFFGVTHANVHLVRSDHCLMWIGGTATGAVYSSIIQGIRWVAGGRSEQRSSVTFSLMYWTKPLMRGIVYNQYNAHFYLQLNVRTLYTSRPNYNEYDYVHACGDLNMYPAEITSYNESRAIIKATHWGPLAKTMLAAQRSSASGPWVWPNAGQVDYSEWQRTEPGNASQNCMKMDPWGNWMTHDCTQFADAVLCEADVPVNAYFTEETKTLPTIPLYDTNGAVRLFSKGSGNVVQLAQIPGSDNSFNADFWDGNKINDNGRVNARNNQQLMGAGTTQLIYAQCMSGDVFRTGNSGENWGGTYATSTQWNDNICSLHAYGAQSLGAMTNIFSPASGGGTSFYAHAGDNRGSYTFMQMFSPDIAVSYVIGDFESRKMISVLIPPAPVTFDAARKECLKLNGHTMLMPTHARELDLLRRYMGNKNAPLNMKQVNGQFVYWNDANYSDFIPLPITDWAPGQPSNPAYNCAGMFGSVSGQWMARDCADVVYDRILCETYTAEYWWSWTVTQLPTAQQALTNLTINYAYQLANLPVASAFNIPIYGATLQNDNCHQFDNFYFGTYVDDDIAFMRQEDCLLVLGGKTSITKYNLVLNGSIWKGTYPLRTVVHFSYIYWISPYVKDQMWNEIRSTVFFSIYSTTEFTPVTPVYSAATLCSLQNASVAEIMDLTDNRQVKKAVQTYGQAYINAKLVGSQYEWGSGAPMVYHDFYPMEPNNITQGYACLVAQVGGGWVDINCNSRVNGVVCMYPVNTSFAGLQTQPILEPTLALDTRTNDTQTFVMRWSGGSFTPKANVFGDPARSAGAPTLVGYARWLNFNSQNVQTVFGVTVQITNATCRKGVDTLTSTATTLGAIAGYTSSICQLQIQLTNTLKQSLNDAYDVVRGVTMTTTDPTLRYSMGFTFALWTLPQTTAVFFDHETRRYYSMMTTSLMSWQEAYVACRNLAPGFTLAEVPNSAVHAWMIATRTSSPVPIALTRNTTGVFGVWRDPAWAPQYYSAWDAGYPNGVPGLDDCAYLPPSGVNGSNAWRDGRCQTKMFTSVVCMNETWDFAGAAVWVADPATYPANAGMNTAVFQAGEVPTNGQLVYGATIMESWANCKAYDRIMMKPGAQDAWILPIRDEDCLLMLAGRRTAVQYAPVLLGLQFRAVFAARATVSFGLVLWTDPHVRELVIDVRNNHVYTTFTGVMTWAKSATGYPGYPPPKICNDVAMYPVEVQDKAEADEVRRSALLYTVFVGAVRPTVGAPFQYYTSGGPMLYADFYPRNPLTTNLLCMSMQPGGGWQDANCTLPLQGVTCEMDTYPNVTSVTRTVAITAANAETTARFFSYSTTTGVMSPNPMPGSMLGYLATSTTAYGATLALLVTSCLPSIDVMSQPSATIPTLSWYYSTGTCHMEYTGLTTHSTLYTALTTTVFTTNVYDSRFRTALTFSYVIWSDSRMQGGTVAYDHESRKVVFFFDSIMQDKTWDTAYARCRSFGTDWTLMEQTERRDRQILHTLLFNNAALSANPAPILIVKNSSGAFGLWRDGVSRPTAAYTAWSATGDSQPTPWVGDCAMARTGVLTSWEVVNCSQVAFMRIPCQNTNYQLASSFMWLLASSSYSAHPNMVVSTPIPAAVLPTGSLLTATVYGATVMQRRRDCVTFDRFTFTASDDRIAVVRDQNCLAMLGGVTTIARYNTFVQAIQWRGVAPFRSAVSFSYAYWTSPDVRELIINFETAAVYAVNFHQAPYVNRAWYAWYSPATYCNLVNMQLADFATLNELYEASTALREGFDASTGLFATSTAAAFTWTTGAAMSVKNWRPLEPLLWYGDNYCASLRAIGNMGEWYTSNCSKTQPTLMCKNTSWPMVGTSTSVLTPATPMSPTTLRTIGFNALGVMTSNPIDATAVAHLVSSSSWVTPIYGATVHVAIQQCMSGDTLAHNTLPATNVPNWFSRTYDSSRCALHITGERNPSIYAAVLPGVTFSASVLLRQQVTFVWILH